MEMNRLIYLCHFLTYSVKDFLIQYIQNIDNAEKIYILIGRMLHVHYNKCDTASIITIDEYARRIAHYMKMDFQYPIYGATHDS